MRSLDLYRETIASGGGTLHASTLDPIRPSSGWAVAIVPNDGSIQCDADNAAAFMVGIARLHADYPATPYIGTWVNDGTIYIDPVVILPDRESVIALARALGQLAVYNFATGEAEDVA